MRSSSFAVTLLALLLGMPALAEGQMLPGAERTDWERQAQQYSAESLKEFNAMMARWRAAWVQGNLKAATDLYAEGAYLMLPDTDLLEGRARIQEALSTRLPRVEEVRTGLTDFMTSDRLAYAVGPFFFQMRDESGATQTLSGTFMAVAVRDGRGWKIRSQVMRLEPEISAAGETSR